MRGNFEGIFIIDCLVESLPYNGCAARLHSFPLFLSFISLFLFLFERGVSKAFSEDKTLSANVRTPTRTPTFSLSLSLPPSLPPSLSLSLHSICHFVEEKGILGGGKKSALQRQPRASGAAQMDLPILFLPHSCLAFLGNLGSLSLSLLPSSPAAPRWSLGARLACGSAIFVGRSEGRGA